MASIIKANNIQRATGTDITVGVSGDTVTIPTGAGLTVTDEVKTNKISPATGVAFALGDSGDTFTVPSGATIVNSGTATGFGDPGLSDVSQWRLNATTNSGTNAVVSANWEEVDYANYERIGSALTESSGVFTFPSTGKWFILSSFYLVTGTGDNSANVVLQYTLNDGVAYTDAHYAATGMSSGTGRGSVVNTVLFDCTDVSNDKIQFTTTSFASGTNLYGETNDSYSVVTFQKLGAT